MSFLSDVFSGNFSNLGNDLAPSSIFSDFGSDAGKALSNPAVDVGLGLGGLALGGLALPALGDLLIPAAGEATAEAAAGGAGAAAIDPALGFAGDVATADPFAAATYAPDSGLTAIDSALSPATNAASPVMSNLIAGAGGGAGGGLTPPATLGDFSFADNIPGLTGDNTALLQGGAGTAQAATGAPTSLAPVTPTTPGTAAPATSQSWLQQNMPWLASTASTLKDLTPVIGAAGLGLNLYSGYQQKQQMNTLKQQEATAAGNASVSAQTAETAAAPLLSQGSTLMSYLTTGTLPKAFQAQITESINAAKASVIQGYATRGMSTDPQKNSSLAQDLNNVEQQSEILKTQLEQILSSAGNQMVSTANSLLSSGLQATQLSAELPIQVAQLSATLNAQMSTAIANFAAAMNGGKVSAVPTGQQPGIQLAA